MRRRGARQSYAAAPLQGARESDASVAGKIVSRFHQAVPHPHTNIGDKPLKTTTREP